MSLIRTQDVGSHIPLPKPEHYSGFLNNYTWRTHSCYHKSRGDPQKTFSIQKEKNSTSSGQMHFEIARVKLVRNLESILKGVLRCMQRDSRVGEGCVPWKAFLSQAHKRLGRHNETAKLWGSDRWLCQKRQVCPKKVKQGCWCSKDTLWQKTECHESRLLTVYVLTHKVLVTREPIWKSGCL